MPGLLYVYALLLTSLQPPEAPVTGSEFGMNRMKPAAELFTFDEFRSGRPSIENERANPGRRKAH
jgi:hypothetical protein